VAHAVLRTARLTLRPVEPRDHARLHAIVTQPGVRRFLFDDTISPPELVAEMIEKSRASFDARGFGLWMACADDAILGFCAFWFLREANDLELLYAVADEHVRRGYGREMARALVDYAFGALQWDVVRASTDAPNHASRRVLEDLGFTLTRQAIVDGLDTVFYERHRGGTDVPPSTVGDSRGAGG
jgi:RimJ/RimL family protein N-acetyltransferase